MKTITVYQTDFQGFYLYPVQANEFPLAPGMYNIPFGAYQEEPPAAQAGMVARWIGEEWELVEDHRKDMLYVASSGIHYEIGSIVNIDGVDNSYDGGGPVPAWLTDVAPVEEQPA